jgi:uncharacterized membrane protein YecN with MAPEG domain
MPVHTALFAALSCLFLSALAGLTSRLRIKHKIFSGYGDRPDLQRMSRAHGVSFEHLLPMLLLLLVLELCGGDRRLIDAFGVVMLLSRLSHVVGFVRGNHHLRVGGMTVTYVCETALALAVLVQAARLI